MSLLFYERARSRSLSQTVNSAAEPLKWIAGQSLDENAVYVGLKLVAPLIWDSLPRQKITADPLGGGWWDCEVEYGFSAELKTDAPDAPEAPDDTTALGPEFAFDITAESAHITQSLATVSKTASTGWGTPPDYKQAIGVTRDRIEGVDVFSGHMEFTVRVQYYPILLPYLRTLLGMVGTVNNATWYQFPAGSLLYLGATGECKPGNVWTLTHKFAASPNLTNIQIGPQLVVAAKNGWDYLWCVYLDQIGSAGFLTQVPIFAYVEQVYRYTDYTLLGLGGP